MPCDVASILFACLLFPVVCLTPGYAVGFLFDVLGFRTRSLACRFALSVALSIAFGPIFSYFVGRWFSLRVVCALYIVIAVGAFADIARNRLGGVRGTAGITGPGGLVVAWAALAILSLSDLQIGKRLYFSVIGFDYAVRTAFTNSISTFGLPPRNPFFFPGHAVALRYHYFWLTQAALIHKLGSPLVGPRQAMMAGSVWCLVGLSCTIALYLRFFSPRASADISRRTLAGIALLGVTGLDIIPALLILVMVRKGLVGILPPSVEWWNEQVDGFFYTIVWEPHYIASLIACLTGFLVLWNLRAGRTQFWISAIVAGLAFASSVGLAIYVAIVFSAFLALWTIIISSRRDYRGAAALIVAGLVAAALAAPYLLSLRTQGSGGPLLVPAVRAFFPGEIVLKAIGLVKPWQLHLGDAFLLPVNYFLELGFFFVVGAIAWRRFRGTRQELAAIAMAGSSILACTFLKSGVIGNNDLGWRGFLIAQFMLLIAAADLTGVTAGQRRLLGVLLILGGAGVAYDLAILRFFPILSDADAVPKIAWLSKDNQLGFRTLARRDAYRWMQARTREQAIIQGNPNEPIQDTPYGLYADRQTLSADTSCGTAFGGDTAVCEALQHRLLPLFAAGETASSQSFARACAALPVDYFAAKDTDAAWRDRASWIWTRRPAFANDFVRLFRCPY